MIPNLGYAYPQGYEPGHLGVRENNINNAEKGKYVNRYIYAVQQDAQCGLNE